MYFLSMSNKLFTRMPTTVVTAVGSIRSSGIATLLKEKATLSGGLSVVPVGYSPSVTGSGSGCASIGVSTKLPSASFAMVTPYSMGSSTVTMRFAPVDVLNDMHTHAAASVFALVELMR